ncbi:unnamed protein product [Bursaphelenchus okinawaensis]|uniref:Guanylate cyclase n=1 Tax=Bursaphelenchus okinawaensis TaxID=465554 RepID=A0A811L1Y3_9BILA|nr:unnamed protein product [Bursaphelenchus okinawaensis]CAG9117234.1 unnamed protein product [Bursaphelenchus okinawaensis]
MIPTPWYPPLLVLLLLAPTIKSANEKPFKKEDSDKLVENASNNATGDLDSVVVKVGHIGAIGVMPKSEEILAMCRDELWKEGILDKMFDIDIINAMGCGESYEGVAVGADMYHQQNVKVFIGPYCNAEMDAVSKMAAFWNVPIIGYMAASTAFSDKKIYKTTARVSLRTINFMALATAATLKHYSWNKIAIVTQSGAAALERVQAFEEVIHNQGINVIKKVILDENSLTKDILASGSMDQLKYSARIIVCIFSNTREMNKEFMSAATAADMNSHEYVFILPWLQAEAKDLPPWIGPDGQTLANVKAHFANAIIIDDSNGFDNALLTPFKEKVSAFGINADELNLENIYGYIHLYDALKLYCLAARKAINSTGRLNVIEDGRLLWNTMRGMTFPGLISAAGASSGTVIMDGIAERAGVYAAFYVSSKKDENIKVVEMTPTFMKNCDGIANRSSCIELKLNDTTTGFWPSIDGRIPKDEPDCGFRGEHCDYTLIMVGGVLAIVAIILALCGFLICRSFENKALDKNSWRIFRDDLRLINSEELKSMMSISSAKTKLSNNTQFAKHHAVIGTNTHASYHMYPQLRTIKFAREDLQLLTQMKLVVHDNVNPFLGMSFNEKEEMLILWKFCSRGTVQDIIYNDEMALDSKFHAAFIRDITLGLEYLHLSTIGYHGSLTPWSCLIDRNWMIKLTDYGIANPIERWIKQGAIGEETLMGDDEKSGAIQATNALYCAPEQLANRDNNKRRRMDQNWQKQSVNRRQAGDIYAFGMIMHEIMAKKLPFSEDKNINELCAFLKDGSKVVKPQVQKNDSITADLVSLLEDCWSTNPELRPSIRRVRLNTEHYLKVKGSLVDQMMRMMEQYANNLEKLVQERTGMLEEANERADKLLNQLLPRYVATELKMGRAVPPKMFKEASVMFTDIVGFTTICSTSTPLEVVTMLNNVYTGFDNIISKNGAYKVETIGDAYMIVSGIPQENGSRHLMNISDVALGFMAYLKDFPVPHRPESRIRIRAGLHTGGVAAGVVGSTTPRYCLFGDTVNMASRMESTGSPQQIQVSEQFKMALSEKYPEYKTTLRGESEIKGKGMCMTYWLEGTAQPA